MCFPNVINGRLEGEGIDHLCLEDQRSRRSQCALVVLAELPYICRWQER